MTDEQVNQLITEVQTRTVASVLGTLRQLGVDLDIETGKLSISADLIQSQLRALQPSQPQPMSFVQPQQQAMDNGVRALPIPAEVMQAQGPPSAAAVAADQQMLAQAAQARFMPPPGLPASNAQPYVQRLSPPPPPAPAAPTQDPAAFADAVMQELQKRMGTPVASPAAQVYPSAPVASGPPNPAAPGAPLSFAQGGPVFQELLAQARGGRR